ncbi:MAG: HisA/HisF-related TIM barrel protein [Colwellia sp.]
MQSRNFRLQKVGDINWLEKNYQLKNISFSLDELTVVDATKDSKCLDDFARTVSRLVDDVFIPVAAGGGISKISDAELLFNSGADKIIVNTSLHANPDLIAQIVARFGSQSIVASVDYKVENGKPVIYIENGTKSLDLSLDNYISLLHELNVGEVYLNSMDRDGTGFGYDLEVIKSYSHLFDMPLIVSGGAGNGQHMKEALSIEGVTAVATANLFNFVGDGLPKARNLLIGSGANLAKW